MSVFIDQTILKIRLDTNQSTDLATATVKKIVFLRPDGTTGFWTATASGAYLEYQTDDGDIDQSGIWNFQAYYEISGKKAWGEIQSFTFKIPIQ